jgi:predicted PurR-regulated permease PerM
VLIVGAFAAGLALFVWGLGSARIPLILAVALGYLVFPLVQKLEAIKIPRVVAVITVFLLSTGATVGLSLLILPHVYDEGHDFLVELPRLIGQTAESTSAYLQKLGIHVPRGATSWVQLFQQRTSEMVLKMMGSFGDAASTAFQGIANVVVVVVNFLLFPVFFFYIVMNYEKFEKKVIDLVPPRLRSDGRQWIRRVNHVFKVYFRGQILVCIILAAFYALGLIIVGLRFGLVIGAVAGLLGIVPYMGILFGLGSSLLLCLVYHQSWPMAGWVLLVFGCGQVLDALFLTPRVIGSKVGLHPLFTLGALIIGANFFGIAGMIIAIPGAALIRDAYRELLLVYRNSSVYQSSRK